MSKIVRDWPKYVPLELSGSSEKFPNYFVRVPPQISSLCDINKDINVILTVKQTKKMSDQSFEINNSSSLFCSQDKVNF